jgi:uncharacterized protein YacL
VETMTQNNSSEDMILDVPYGNGKSMKFFNLIYKYYLVWFFMGLLSTFNNWSNVYKKYYEGDASLFYSVRGNIFALLFALINFVLEVMLLRFALKKAPQKFSMLYLISIPVSILGQIIGIMLYIQQMPELTSDFLNQLVPVLVIQFMFYIPIYIYFKKRLPQKNVVIEG